MHTIIRVQLNPHKKYFFSSIVQVNFMLAADVINEDELC